MVKLTEKEFKALGMIANVPGHWTEKSLQSIVSLQKKGLVILTEGKAYLAEGAAKYLNR